MSARRKMVRPMRFTIARNDVACILWALEAVIEDYEYDGGTILAEDEIRLRDRFEVILREYDSKGRYAA